MNKGITFYKLISPYPEDTTKGCGLVGSEIDQNFFNLKEMDINKTYLDGYVLVLERIGGEKLYIDLKPLLGNMTTNFSVDFNKTNGTIVISHNGYEEIIDGLITVENLGESAMRQVVSDGTLYGNGTKSAPLRISPAFRCGTYAPVKRMIDLTEIDSSLPCKNIKGDRYLTREMVNEFGKLYDYFAVRRIQEDLDAEGKGWRIPTKADWDNMLNAIEPCDEYKTHNQINGNVQGGKYAGRFLKSVKYWKASNINNDQCGTFYADNSFVGYDVACSNSKCCCPTPTPPPLVTPEGIDAFGMGILPSGYGDGGQLNGYFLERTMFWTSTMTHVSDVYVKRFDYNKATVVQEIISPKNIASIRLVKDYTGDNHFDTEYINGQDYKTVLLPAENTTNGHLIWTTTNVDFTDCRYCPIEPNNGLGLPLESTYYKYYINEWDGFKWVKKQMQEGESVVLMIGLNGKKNIEYRIVNGELVSEVQMVFEEVLEDVSPKLDYLQSQINTNHDNIQTLFTTTENLQFQINNNSERISSEEETRIKNDRILADKIQTLSDDNNTEHAEINQRIDEEIKNRENADNNILTSIRTLSNTLQQEILDRQSGDARLNSKIDNLAEKQANDVAHLHELLRLLDATYKEADAKLQAQIDELTSEHHEDSMKIWEAINKEIQDRVEADDVLLQTINQVIEDYKAADAELDKKISDLEALHINETTILWEEIQKLVQADKDIISRIDAIEADYKAEDEKIWDSIQEIKDYLQEHEGSSAEEIANIKERLDKLETDLAAEIERSTAKDAEIESRLLTKDGHEFNCRKGYLKLNTEGKDNVITIQLDSNYGTF